ncbi:hypothetical protein [Pedococcus sp. P5_B7]
MSSTMGRLLTPAVAAVSARAVSMTGAFALTTVYLRSMQVREAGLVLFIYTVLAVAATVAVLGGNTLAMRDSARDATSAAATIRHTAALSVLASPAVSVLLVIAILVQGRGTTSVWVAVVAGLTVAPWALSTVAGSTLRGLGRVGAGTLAEVGLSVWVAAIGMAVMALLGHATAIAAVVMLLVGNVITMVWSCWLVTRLVPSVRQASPGLGQFLRQQRHTLSSFLTASLGSYLFVWLPVVVLGYVNADAGLAQHDVATFNAGARPAQFVAIVALIQASYLGPRFARLFHVGDLEGLARVSRRSVRWAGAWGVLFCAVAVVRPQAILAIFGGYADAAPILTTLTVGGLVVVLIGPVSQVMLVAGLERDARTFTLVLLVLAAVGLPLLAHWGTFAVSVGTAVTAVAYAVACWVRLGRAGIDVGPISLRRAPTRSGS